MRTYHIEHTPAGRGFAFGGEVSQVSNWEEAVEGAMSCAGKAVADRCNHLTVFWAVIRESEEGSAARRVVYKQEFDGTEALIDAAIESGRLVRGPQGWEFVDGGAR